MDGKKALLIMPEIQGQLVLAQNQHAFIQDATKGTVQVYAGPHSLALSANDRPVVYDKNKDEFVQVDIRQAIKQNRSSPRVTTSCWKTRR